MKGQSNERLFGTGSYCSSRKCLPRNLWIGDEVYQAPGNEVFLGALLGFLWGIGGIMFGISAGYIGITLTCDIVIASASTIKKA